MKMRWIVIVKEPNLTQGVGPFDGFHQAERYADRQANELGVISAVAIPLIKASILSAIHPDQSSIADYIDPSVAN